MRIAYLVNQYPKVSHTFIRREVLALERSGCEVQRISLRGWDANLVDAEDVRERRSTRYVLQGGLIKLLITTLRTAIRHPIRFLSALGMAMRMSVRAMRPLPYHLAYLAEACCVLAWVRQFGATHVHAHFGTNTAEIAMLAYVLGGPSYSFTVHGPDEFDNAMAIGLPEKIKRAAFVVAVSSFGRSQIYRWLDHVHWCKVKVVHCGLEKAFYDAPVISFPVAPRLVCVGRLCEQKGQILLVEAASLLLMRAVSFELVLAGDGEIRNALDLLIHVRGLEKHVRITGWLSGDQVRKEILSARALVVSSFAEGLPVVIMEAMALGRPIVSSCIAGIPELVRDGKEGWLVPAGDIEALATALEQVLTCAPSELQSRGAAAQIRALERHSIDVSANTLSHLFRESCQHS